MFNIYEYTSSVCLCVQSVNAPWGVKHSLSNNGVNHSLFTVVS